MSSYPLCPAPVLESANELDPYKQHQPAPTCMRCLKKCVESYPFLWNGPKSFVSETYCLYLYDFNPQLFCRYIFIKTCSYTQASLSAVLLIWIRRLNCVQWNLSLPNTPVTKAWIFSSPQTHERVDRIWSPFYQSPAHPQRKSTLYSLKLKFCSWYLYKKNKS